MRCGCSSIIPSTDRIMKKAFTLVELLVVIGIISILAGILIAALSGSGESAKAVKCLTNMKNISNAIHAQGMGGMFPLAGSVDVYATDMQTSNNKGIGVAHGWIGWQSDQQGSGYISPYSSDEELRRKCFENGAIWKAVSANSSVYVCPVHREIVKKQLGSSLPNGPAWSYVVNARFGWMYKSSPFIHTPQQQYDTMKRSDRVLLLAELPFLKNYVQDPTFNSGAAKENDPILQYRNCEGGGQEVMGFNHKQGKRDIYAHVCFADGHTEKFKLPKNANVGNLTDLTQWLCMPTHDGKYNGKQIDVIFNGEKYDITGN